MFVKRLVLRNRWACIKVTLSVQQALPLLSFVFYHSFWAKVKHTPPPGHTHDWGWFDHSANGCHNGLTTGVRFHCPGTLARVAEQKGPSTMALGRRGPRFEVVDRESLRGPAGTPMRSAGTACSESMRWAALTDPSREAPSCGCCCLGPL